MGEPNAHNELIYQWPILQMGEPNAHNELIY